MSKPGRSNTRFTWPIAAALVLAIGTLTCTIDDPQLTNIGAVTIFPVNPSIVSQSVTLAPPGTVSGNRMQTAIWTLARADLTIDGRKFDLLFKESESSLADCRAIDTPTRATLAFGDCLDVIVVEAADASAGSQATLELTFWVRFKRVIPLVLPLIGDEDGDGLLNGNDNCPLVPNADQADTGGFGIGDACRVVDVFSGVQLDSDADGVADRVDNCVHIANPLQVNPPSSDFPDIEAVASDGIGLACEPYVQVIDIGRPATPPMNPMDPQGIEVIPPIQLDFVLPRAQGFVVIDFDDAVWAPDCEWSMGTCTNFDPQAIKACIRTNAFEAVQGCD